MWETIVRVDRSLAVRAAPERVWSLLSSPAVWSLRPSASFVFDVPWSLPGAGRFCFYISAAPGGIGAAVLEVCDEVPGELISFQSRSSQTIGRQAFTLSVRPAKRGTKAQIAISHVVPRAWKPTREGFWRDELKKWLDAVKAVVEGRKPWPGTEMPAALRERCMSLPPPADPESVSATVLIGAPRAAVWEAVQSPEAACAVNPQNACYAGYVPGTPQREAGEMQYFVTRRGAGQLIGTVVVVTQMTAERIAVTQRVGRPQDEMHYLLEPASSGTRLELISRWSPRALQADQDAFKAWMADFVQATAAGYKSMIEKSPGRHW